MSTPADMPARQALGNGWARETFQAFARADSRAELMDLMRKQAESYFGCKVEMREASAQLAPTGKGARTYQGSSRWVARP